MKYLVRRDAACRVWICTRLNYLKCKSGVEYLNYWLLTSFKNIHDTKLFPKDWASPVSTNKNKLRI